MEIMPKANDTTYYNILYLARTNAPAYFKGDLRFTAWLHVTRPGTNTLAYADNKTIESCIVWITCLRQTIPLIITFSVWNGRTH